MEYHSNLTDRDLLTSLNTQRLHGHFCDVTLMVGDDVIPAHKCILAASSDYFRARFLGDLGDLGDCNNTDTCDMTPCELAALQDVVTYIYTGEIHLSLDSVEGVLQVVDFLGIPELKAFCADLLQRHLDVNTCVQIKALVDQYSLEEIRSDVMDFLVPRMTCVLATPDVMEIPFNYVYSLLSDHHLNYIRESDILEFIFRWINHSPGERYEFTPQLIACVDFSYIGSEYITRHVTNSKDIEDVLLPEQRKVVHIKLSQQEFPNRMDDVIICRSRCNGNHSDEVTLLVYVICEDRWYTLNNCPEHHLLDGVESMVSDHGALYLLVSKTDDLCGYGREVKVSKELWKVSLDRGVWEQVASPENLCGQSRLIPHVRGLYVIDRTGVIQKYDNMTRTWITYSGPGFDNCPNSTMYMLPMPMDRFIYILRGFSEGYSFDYAQMSFSLHRYDTDKYSWTTLSHIEAGELELGDNERFHGYTATTSSLLLKDTLGFSRLKYDLITNECTNISPDVTVPRLISEIWGSAEHVDKVYFSGRMAHETPVFMMYDHNKKRFKMVATPPRHVSGLMCHVVTPRTFREVLTGTG